MRSAATMEVPACAGRLVVESSAALGALVRKTGHVSVVFQPQAKGLGTVAAKFWGLLACGLLPILIWLLVLLPSGVTGVLVACALLLLGCSVSGQPCGLL